MEQEGVCIYPKPAALKIIKNKILQKQFYKEHEIPTSDFVITQNINELKAQHAFLPAVHKLATGGYDGKGVQLIKKTEDLINGFDTHAILEKMIFLKKELAVIIAVNDKGQSAVYAPVDMVFDHSLNLLSHQIAPADLPDKIFWKAEAIALKVVRDLKAPAFLQLNFL